MTILERQNLMISMRENGVTLKDIGEKFSMTKQGVASALSKKYQISVCLNCCENIIYTKFRKFCCRDCKVKWIKLNRKNKEVFALNHLQGRDRIREMVRIRDNHTCQDCKKKWNTSERRFDVHHLNGLCGKKSKKYDRVSEIDGLITLCHKCHFNRPEHTLKKLSE